MTTNYSSAPRLPNALLLNERCRSTYVSQPRDTSSAPDETAPSGPYAIHAASSLGSPPRRRHNSEKNQPACGSHGRTANIPAPIPTDVYLGGFGLSTALTVRRANSSRAMAPPWVMLPRAIIAPR